MSKVSMLYYRTSEGPAYEFCQAWRSKQADVGRALTAWVEEQGATGWIPGSKNMAIDGWAINGLIFPGDATIPEGLRRSKRLSADGKAYYRPAQNTQAGRKFAAYMRDAEGLPSPDDFCTEFGFPFGMSYKGNGVSQGTVRTATYMLHTCQIGWIGDVFWVVLPDLDTFAQSYIDQGYEVTDGGSWTVPAGLELSSKARYDLALAEQAVALEERKAA